MPIMPMNKSNGLTYNPAAGLHGICSWWRWLTATTFAEFYGRVLGGIIEGHSDLHSRCVKPWDVDASPGHFVASSIIPTNRGCSLMAPFLEVLTRTFGQRPHLLRYQPGDITPRQTDPDWIQTIVRWMTRREASVGHLRTWQRMRPNLVGEYIFCLDDDDTCILPTLVEELKFIVADSDPDVIMIRMDHGAGRILPGDDTWLCAPVLGQIGCSAFVVRREVWQRHAMRNGAWPLLERLRPDSGHLEVTAQRLLA